MEGSSGGGSWFDVTKTKLLVLSSLAGIGTIIYFTKNYLDLGHFFPSSSHAGKKSNIRQPTIIGGKHNVIIKEDVNAKDGIAKKIINRQRSRQSSMSSSRRRRDSVLSNSKHRSGSIKKENMDINLNTAINELSDSVKEVEEILGLKNDVLSNERNDTSNSNIGNHIIEGEIKKLRKLIDIAQDANLVTDRTSDYVLNCQQIMEDIIPVIEPELFEEQVDMAEMFDDYDSDSDSFISATESLDLELSDEEEYENAVAFSMKLKELIKKHCKDDFYMQGIEFLTHYGVPVRSIHTEMLACDNDVDFCVKVYCLRQAFTNILKNDEHKKWFIDSGKEMLVTLLKEANYDHIQFSLEYDKMMDYCSDPENWSDIDIELSGRGVCNLNFYDIVLDLLIMDSFEDINNPPSAVISAIQNRWLSVRIKETALSTAIWTVIKAKRHRVDENGFFARFYDISMYVTPLLAWGFLGPVNELNNLCTKFKDTMMDFLRDIFSVESANYKSVQTLAEDILSIARKRKQDLMSMISR